MSGYVLSAESLTVLKLTADSYVCHFEPVTLWDTNVEVGVFVPAEVGAEEHVRKRVIDLVPLLEQELAWLDSNKETTVKEMDGDKEKAEEWVWEDPDFFELSDDEGYAEIDGVRVNVPIADEDFASSLFLWSVTFEPAGNSGLFKMSLEIGCSPDYFSGHRIHVKLDEHKHIVSEGI